jgi:hypothetical protein
VSASGFTNLLFLFFLFDKSHYRSYSSQSFFFESRIIPTGVTSFATFVIQSPFPSKACSGSSVLLECLHTCLDASSYIPLPCVRVIKLGSYRKLHWL